MRAPECDYLVIGAGAAGCAVAGRLSEDGASRVLLLEAGGGDHNPLLRIPGTGLLISAAPAYNWNFQTEPIEALGGRRLVWLQGRVLGGSSAINGMIYARGHSREYDIWRQIGCEGWSFEGVEPYFRRLEGRDGDGPLKLKRSQLGLPVCDGFLEAAAQSGYDIVDDLNADVIEGFGTYDVNIERGRRVSAARAYIHPARRRPNLRVFTRAQALRLVIEHGRAVGAEIEHRGRRRLVRAAREVVVCGGGVKSPHLLMLSGVGPAAELEQHGIPVVVDAPRVGRNLQNHPCYRVQYACAAPATAFSLLQPRRALAVAVDYALRRRGPLAESFVTAGGFLRTDPTLDLPDVQVVLLAALVNKAQPGRRMRLSDLLPREEGFAITIYQGTPFSRGEIGLHSADPLAPPRIVPRYFSDPRDMQVLIRGVQRMRQVMQAPAMRKLISREIAPGPSVTTDAELADEIRRNAATSYHQSGSCAMGSDAEAVVDPQLRVRGVAGLRVADASIIPRLPTAALHAVSLMIGEKAAAMIRGE